MKICDRCFRAGDVIPAYDNIMLGAEYQTVDLCKPCMEAVSKYAVTKELKFEFSPEDIEVPDNIPKKRGRPKKHEGIGNGQLIDKNTPGWDNPIRE